MSLRTCKKKSLIKKQEEQTAREKRTAELLTCEKAFSLAQQNTIIQLREKHAEQLQNIQEENNALILQLAESEDGIQIMQAYMHEQSEQHTAELARLDYRRNEAISQKQKELEDKELNYKNIISALEKKLNVAKIEISYLKNYKKPHFDAIVQTSVEAATRFSAQRTIPLSEHLATIKSIKEEFYKEKFKIHDEYQEKLSKMTDQNQKKETDNSIVDKRNVESYKLCEGSKIVATLEQQNSAKNKKKMQELIEYYLKCLDEKSRQCRRQQDLIQKLQILKKRQADKIQLLIKSVNQKNTSQSTTTRDLKNLLTKRDVSVVKKLVQQVVVQSSEN